MWKFAHRQHLKFCHFQHVHCARKNPISPRVFKRFSKSLLQLEDVEGRHLGWKFQVRRNFTFAMARWKLCASTTFDILTLSTCTVCQQKSFISKGIQPIFEIFASARRSWEWGIWVESVRCAGILLLQWQGENFALRQHLKFLPLLTCTLCQQKSYISEGVQPIFEIFPSARRCWRWAFGWKVSGAQVFYFCNSKVKTLRIDNIWNFCHFQHVYFASKNPISPKVFNRFSKSLLQLEDVEGVHLGGKFQVRRYFTFAMARWKLCTSSTFDILPLLTCTVCQQKSYISKGIESILENLGSARRCWGWAFEWKVSGAQVFCFCNGKVKTLRIENIWNFATFNLYTVPAKIPISPKVFNLFSKSFSSSRRYWG